MVTSSRVLIKKTRSNYFNLRGDVFDFLDLLIKSELLPLKQDSCILIKPNLCSIRGPESGTTVDPYLVKHIVDWLNLHLHPKSICIAEADASALDVDLAFTLLGWRDLFNQPNVRLINLSKEPTIELDLNGTYIKKVAYPKIFLESDLLISIAKLKTHMFTKLSGVLKNQFGANPVKYKAKYHAHLDQVITDLNKVRIPDLCLVDGIIGMEGKGGPVFGTPKPTGLLIGGNDPVATDHACARLMGFNPKTVKHLEMAKTAGIGSFSYETFGEKIEDVRVKYSFEPSKAERFIRTTGPKIISVWSHANKLIKQVR